MNKANRGWRRLRQAFPELLGETAVILEPADLGGSGVVQRLLGGPFDERAAAEKLCAALRAKDRFCHIVRHKPQRPPGSRPGRPAGSPDKG